jgi:caspase domain-containing protein/uncharacterized protein DUF4189
LGRSYWLGSFVARTGLSLIVLVACAVSAMAEKRVALVIGNSAYRNVTPLDNPTKDAGLMADTLRDLGFTLIGNGAQKDLDKAAVDQAIQDFGRQIQGADVAMFYYAGHGVQVHGSNYLVPVNANPVREADVDFQMVDVNLVLNQMNGSGTHLNLVILDACRNNPFGGRGLRATSGGLAQLRAPDGTLISYATQPGNVAQDGDDGHSPYTKALATTMKREGLDIFKTFNEVGLAVKRETAGEQQPWVSSSPIDGTFYFKPPQIAAVPSDAPSETLRADPDRVQLKDPALLSELGDRLYELNFNTDTPDDLTRVITRVQSKLAMATNGQATEGLLMRLRKLEDLKPWGTIVYAPDSNKWAMSWNHDSRRAAVNDARGKCGSPKCNLELSFHGDSCGAFAVSKKSWSLIQRDTVQHARDAALDECNKAGNSCKIIGAVCANGTGR